MNHRAFVPQRCAVMSTSTGSLDYFRQKDPDIRILRLDVLIDGQAYADGQQMNAENFYQWLLENPDKLATTRPPQFDYISEQLMDLYMSGYTDVIITTIAASLSKTFERVREVAALMQGRLNVHVFDTGSVSVPEGMFAQEASRLLKKGFSVDEVLVKLETLRSKCVIIFGVNSLRYLVKNGRLSMAGGLIGSMLQVKPILKFENSAFTTLQKVRKTENAIEAVTDAVADYIEGNDVHVSGLYCGNGDLYQEFARRLNDRTGHAIEGYPLSPVAGAHIGPNAFGVTILRR